MAVVIVIVIITTTVYFLSQALPTLQPFVTKNLAHPLYIFSRMKQMAPDGY